jgi:hypothetical protein
MKCGSQVKKPCELTSSLDMRDLSNKIWEICEEAIQNKLGPLMGNSVDKSEAKVRR